MKTLIAMLALALCGCEWIEVDSGVVITSITQRGNYYWLTVRERDGGEHTIVTTNLHTVGDVLYLRK